MNVVVTKFAIISAAIGFAGAWAQESGEVKGTDHPITLGQPTLEPGQFEWQPERSPDGPLLVVCTIDDQMLYVFRNGVQIARSTVSTGRRGKRTPTGVFTILQRKIDHESSIYKGAKMPYMQRLTWTGIAMHAGNLPGYPASAGCIRLPLEFSKLIYGEMQNGSTVVITQRKSTPTKSASPASILMESRARNSSDSAMPKGRVIWSPQKSLHGPVSILLSYADKTVYVWRNGVQIGQSPFSVNSETALPEGVFLMLEGKEPANEQFPGMKMHPWSIISLRDDAGIQKDLITYMRESIIMPLEFRAAVNNILVPGTILLATSEPSTNKTKSSGPMAIMLPAPPTTKQGNR